MKRTPLVRKTPLPRAVQPLPRATKPMAARSAKRAAQERLYATERVAFLDGKVCQRCGTTEALELHHKRGRVGADLLDTDHWAALCAPCHHIITISPAEAIASGLSELRNTKRDDAA